MEETKMTQETPAVPAKKLTKKDITKSMWIYYAGAELSNSYERLQSLVFCASMTPVLKKLYDTDEELSAALKRHLVFFNTEGILGAIIQGIVISMEEQKANGENITDDAITGIKTGLMVLSGQRLCRLSSPSSFRSHPTVLRSVELCR